MKGKTRSNKKIQQSDAVESFTNISSQIKPLLQRIIASHKLPSSTSTSVSASSTIKKKKSSKSSSSTTTSSNKFPLPDEANVALGKQLGSVYTSLYFDCKCWQNDKLKSQWRDLGFDICDNTFCGGNDDDGGGANDGGNDESSSKIVVNKSVISAFFNQLVNDIVSYLNNDIDDYAANTNPGGDGNDQNASNQIIDDICYWWIAIIYHCENRMDVSSSMKSTRNNNLHLSFILQTSIRSYVKYASFAYMHLQNLKTSTSILNKNPQQQSDLLKNQPLSFTFAEKVKFNHSLTNNIGTHEGDDDDDDDDHMQLIRLYNKIELNQYRQFLIREIISTTIQKHTPQKCQLKFMTPLIHKITTNACTSTLDDHERNLNVYISTVMSEYSLLRNQNKNHSTINASVLIISWLIQNCYEPLLTQYENGCIQNDQSVVLISNLIHELGCQLCHIITDLIQKVALFGSKHEDETSTNSTFANTNELVQYYINLVLNRVLSFYINLEQETLISTSINAILSRINSLLSTIHGSSKVLLGGVKVSNSAMYKSVITALLLHDVIDINLQLEICSQLVMIREKYKGINQDSSFSSMIWASIYCLGSIFSATPAWNVNEHAHALIHHATKELNSCSSTRNTESFNQDTNVINTIAGFYYQDCSTQSKVCFMETMSTQLDKYISTTCSQAETTLFLASLVVQAAASNISDNNLEVLKHTYSTFDKILETLPHLGRRSLIVLKGALQLFIATKSTVRVQQLLEFICGSVARDASCAHEIWAMIAMMIDPAAASIKVQSMILRLYPLLCKTNKRLYGRICESIGKYVAHPNAQLRSITASTICELAKNDLVRDVSDVIGWVQSYLTDEEDLIVYHAILSLYYLVLTGELDFVIVLKVLNKKLVKFDDSITKVLDLSDIVIEAFVKFLGVGESAEDDDSSDSEDDDVERSISPHVQLSINTLCALTLSEGILINPKLTSYEDSKKYILEQLYESLSQYSAKSFDIDEDVICQEEYEEDNLYFQMRRIVDAGKYLVETCDIFKDDTRFESAVKMLTLTLEEIEQHSPVSMRWLQQHRKIS